MRLYRTVTTARLGHVPIKLDVPGRCARTDCSLSQFSAWCKGRCPEQSCSLRLSEVASRYGQKMVDTLLTVDAIAIARDALCEVVLIASDDEDILPALLALKDTSLDAVHLVRRGPPPEYYRGILERDGVIIHSW